MRTFLSVAAAALLTAGAAWADEQPVRSDQIKRDGDPYQVGAPGTQLPRATTSQAAPQPATTETTQGVTRMYSTVDGVQTVTIANAPIPDTAANRERFGQPLSAGGRRTKPSGN